MRCRHSAGSLVAVETYFEAPERVAAMILVGPAIVAPLVSSKTIKENQAVNEGNMFVKFSGYIAQAIMGLLKGVVDMISSLYKKALSAFLRTSLAAMLVINFDNKESKFDPLKFNTVVFKITYWVFGFLGAYYNR